ncbi:hypothetical protein Daesc_005463 [Daldinia eschscholtzii]|uniref:Uncharacterized protein n=1 Tax=Daldinia eschscholtzii TaxID=292717 RepID=A0AAX6ML39_9PEZI
MLRLAGIVLLSSGALVASQAPTSLEIAEIRPLLCPFKVSAEISLDSLDVTYDTQALASTSSADSEHTCSVQFSLAYKPEPNSVQVEEIDYDGDAEAEIGTAIAWKEMWGPVRFTPAKLIIDETGPQRVTNTTPPMRSSCNFRDKPAPITIHTTVVGKLGSQIKQSLKLNLLPEELPNVIPKALILEAGDPGNSADRHEDGKAEEDY